MFVSISRPRWQAIIFSIFLFFTLISVGNAQAQQSKPAPTAPQPLNLSSVVVMGDSLSHSYHDGVLHTDAQSQNYLTLLSKQLGFELRQGLIVEPGGFGGRFSLKDPSKLTKPLDTQSFLNLTLPPVPQTGGRVDPSVRVNNFAIGGAKVTDIINDRPDPMRPDRAIYASLGIPWLSDNPPITRSQLEFVEASKPTLAILFIGGNDALGAASSSNLALLTPPDKFLQDYEEIVRRTKAAGAQMILVTVPDVTNVAALIPGRDIPTITKVASSVVVPRTGIQPDDFVTLRAFQSIVDILFFGKQGPVPEDQILRKKMAKKISKTIKKFNDGIKKIGKRENFLVIDINEFLGKATKDGFMLPNGLTINTKYFGGVASYDGVHISLTANAVLANIFIDSINKFYGKSFPLVDVTPIAMADPQVPKPSTVVEPQIPATPEQWQEAKPTFEALSNAMMKLINGDK